MNTTTNYSLPQWEATDRVTREDINGAMSAIDGAIAGKCEVVCGVYTGDNTDSQTIVLGFRPKAVLVSSSNGQFHGGQTYFYGGLVIDGHRSSALEIVDNGFIVRYVASWCYANQNSGHFYIAFR